METILYTEMAWKHHLSKDFIDNPSLTKNNGARKESTIFLEYEFMVDYLKKTAGDGTLLYFYWIIPQ